MNGPADTWKDTFAQQLGLRYETCEPGYVVSSLVVEPELCNPHGVCHGGVMFTLADDAMGAALYPLRPEGHVPTSTQVNIHYARSVRAGARLRAETRVVSRGRRTAVLESRVEDDKGRLLALVTASYLFVEARAIPPIEKTK